MDMNKKPGLNLNINPNDLDDVVCDKCGNPTFIQAVMLKRRIL